MIEFLQDYTTEAVPPESFAKGEQVERSETSERYFVGRGLAAYVVDGRLVDIDHRPLVTAAVAVEVVTPGDRRIDLAVRAGEVMTGQPPRASSGPGTPFVEPAAGTAGAPAVVLEAEIERLKAALATGDDLFRKMSNTHEAEIERLKREAADNIGTSADVVTARDQAVADLAALREQHDGVTADLAAAREQLEAANTKTSDLERQLGEATAAKQTRGK